MTIEWLESNIDYTKESFHMITVITLLFMFVIYRLLFINHCHHTEMIGFSRAQVYFDIEFNLRMQRTLSQHHNTK